MRDSRAGLRVVAAGRLSTVQDLGRPGQFARGVGVSGAADRGALRLANRLTGNPEGAAGIESLLGGLELEVTAHVVLAVTGAEAEVTVDGRPVATHTTLALRPGQHVAVGMPRAGLRTYLAVRGGVDVAPVLGSRSYDTLAGLGPPPLADGDLVPVGPVPDDPLPDQDQAPRLSPPTEDHLRLPLAPGPHRDWFPDPDALVHGAWAVSAEADRVGVWLDGPRIERRSQEIPTEGMCLGAVEVVPSGRACVFLADHPITGGYPVIGVVPRRHLDALAQARPGQPVTFYPAHR